VDRLDRTKRLVGLIVGIITGLASQNLFAQGSCFSLVKGPISFDVEICKPFDPAIFDTSKPKYKFIDDLDTEGKKQLLDSYRGLILKGTVVFSQAIKEGVSTSKGVLQGKNTIMFIPPGSLTCDTIKQKRITANLSEKCCNGTGDVPCLLGNGYILSDVKVAGEAMVGEGIEKKTRKPAGKDYAEAEKFYAAKKYREAVKFYLKAEEAKDMDVKGLFRLGNSYRELERCDLATRPLKKIWALQQASKVFADEEMDARRGVFLLARCEAKNGDASGAVYYLNAFLLDARKYRSELQQALKHKDFGWIHTSKEYQEFKVAAERKLGSTRP
jgi:hypothetical protein